MELTRDHMIERMLRSDASYNGRFITAVRTTHIYCLPGCTARKPRPENVEFYATPDQALAAGYRACKMCRPDDFYHGVDTEERLAERLAEAIWADPASFRDVPTMAIAGGVGQTKLFELFRAYYHTTPADMLARARVEAACRALLGTDATIIAIAGDVGFESLSAFQENFRRHTAMSPSAYRQLREGRGFALALPEGFQARQALAYLGRDPHSLTDRVEGDVWASALRLAGGGAALLRVSLGEHVAQCELIAPATLDAEAMRQIHTHVFLGLGLASDPQRFEAMAAGSPEVARLTEGQRGLRMPLVADHFDGLVWTIIGQQINLPFAYALRSRLTELAGQPLVGGRYAPPAPEAVAALGAGALSPLSFSRSKAAYLVGVAQVVAEGRLPLAQLARRSAPAIERTLLATRGIGPWSAQYMLMRSFGFADCVPVGDAGLLAALRTFFSLGERPDRATTLALMERFAPYRSLATFHLWRRLGTAG
ncbi:DNA-3-methyladenine glycosylase 2 family protein [Chloroflexia bacterium SDU3-3]|nr:DNA-3-methyladenine glycosylase 2 family protein [Chloroflexia bacterium SDU3-3]